MNLKMKYLNFNIFFFLFAVICFAVILSIGAPQGISSDAWKVIAVTVFMAILWITEALPIPVTSLLPILLFPALRVATIEETTAPYASPVIFLLLGGFIIALAVERYNLHKRIALHIINLTSGNANKVIAGFMIATALLSMWISNTATTAMMMPIALSITALFAKEIHISSKSQQNFTLCMMLGTAYAANVGGAATIIGTPPNLVLYGFLEKHYNITISFADWMMFAVPFAIIMLVIIWLVLVKLIYPNDIKNPTNIHKFISADLKQLGPVSHGEKYVIFIFGFTVFLWMFHPYINNLLSYKLFSNVNIAVLGAILCFVVQLNGKALLSWEVAERLPWGIMILFGGGLTLAARLDQSGVLSWIGEVMSTANITSIIVISIIMITAVIFITELISNTTTTIMFLPITVIAGTVLNLPPAMLTIPITLAASCAFMLPVATAPNAIVYGAGHVKIRQMIKVGFVINIIAIIVITLFTHNVISQMFY